MFAGPNGSGKSTLRLFLPKELLGAYLNPDDLEQEIRREGFLDFKSYGVTTTADEVIRSRRMPGEQAKISGFAVASLVASCFLSVGCIPGIVCGHVAVRRLRRNPALLGKRLALAGLLVSYLSLAGTILFIGLKLSAHAGITTVVRKESDEAKLMIAHGVDQVLIGEPESETAHGMQTVNSESGLFFGRRWRATPGNGKVQLHLKSPSEHANGPELPLLG